jgi:hygromycin-B 7''-O-kinase
LLTGEYTPFNLLVERRGDSWELSGMIDFGDAMVGYREYDLLGPSVFLGEGDPGLIGALLQGYGVADPAALVRRLMVLQVLHRFSHPSQLRVPGWERARSIEELERLIWPI